MKLSITLLSSILAVCSVTIANPVDPSSTMSAEVSTPTASTSATSTGESTSITAPGPYDQYLAECSPIGEDGILLIQQYADAKRKYDEANRMVRRKRSKIHKEEKKILGLKEELDSMWTKARRTRNASYYGKKILETEFQIEDINKIIEDLKEQLDEMQNEHSRRHRRLVESQSKLHDYLLEHDTTGAMTTDGPPDLKSIPGFMKCFGIFYKGSPW
ncbi:hypothetical protein O5D80_003189 [Batrachochytrium dendrobatidis]|nr:hypothetical protein O5D80_003189 [Batrachochytrium dendrobatidis]